MGASDDDNLVAVLAHSLIGPVSACQIAAALLRDRGASVPPHVREELLGRIISSSRLATDMMQDLVRGASHDVLDALRALDRPRLEPSLPD